MKNVGEISEDHGKDLLTYNVLVIKFLSEVSQIEQRKRAIVDIITEFLP